MLVRLCLQQVIDQLQRLGALRIARQQVISTQRTFVASSVRNGMSTR